ncbi:BRO-N domain-containing protein [Acinetobacter pittii]|uniref:BRO-N domain-containing protein n=1 Tax=Acinetobacter pittii TaxID=48296 RepID=UPI00301C829E
MTSLALSFNDVKFNPIVQRGGQIWLSSGELAQALDYKNVKSVSNLYSSNKDEFSDSMTQVIESVTSGNYKKKSRIFSLRGCHLIAMFARTAVAKQFRKWVLDILDREVGVPVAKTHKSERTSLHEAHALLVAKTKHLSSSDAWKLIHQRFNVDHIEEIPYDMIPVAVEYVHHLIALMSNKNGNTGLDTNVRAMAIYLAWLSGWWRQFGPAVRGINPHMAAAIHDYFNDGGFVAWSFIEKDKRAELHKRIDTHPWHLPPMDRYHLLNRN